MTTATNEALKEVQEAKAAQGKTAAEKYEQSVKELEEQGKLIKVTTPTKAQAAAAKEKADRDPTAAIKAQEVKEKAKAEKKTKKFTPGLHSTIVVSALILAPAAANGKRKVKITNSDTGKTRTLKSYYAKGDQPNALQLFRTVNDQLLGTYKTGYSLVKQGLGKDTVDAKKFETTLQEPKAKAEAKK